MRRLLLIGINARYTHTNLAVRYLRNNSLDLPYEIIIKEFSINQNLLEILAEIEEVHPFAIAISVYIWNTELITIILPELKKILPSIKIILGGPEVSYNPENWLEKFPEIDFIIINSGETGFRYLLENNLSVSQKIIHKPNPHFSAIKFPYLESDFKNLVHKYIYYESSRGCPFKCSYCLSSRKEQKLEFRDMEDVKKELDFLIFQNIKIVKFVDRTFNALPEFSRIIWIYLIEKNPRIKFHFEIHPGLLTNKDFEILEKCPKDLFQFEIGIQSVNPLTLKEINRYTDWEETKQKIIRLIKLQNIHIHVDLIAGLPYEDFSSIIFSFNEIFVLKADHFQFGFLKILHGTLIEQKTKEYGMKFLNSAPYEILQTKWLSFSEMKKLKKIEKWLNIFYNSQKFTKSLNKLIELHESSFDFFYKFDEFTKNENEDNPIKNWIKNAVLLKNYIKKYFKEHKEYLFDCLRWDWCKIAKSHFYPEFLRTENTRLAKETGFKYIKGFSEKGVINFNNQKFRSEELKKAIFFIPDSQDFRKKVLENEEIAVFFKKDKTKTVIKFSAD